MVQITLSPQEIAVLDRQHPSTKNKGGWQGLLVKLAQKVNRATGRITLTASDLERIQRYAFGYGNGGWENRLRWIFGRSLGPTLGGQYLKRAA
jgi:hypothetical protein